MEPWQLVLLKDYQEEDEAWLPGERRVRGPGRKPSTWLPWFPGAGTCAVTVHSPGVRPGGHACQSPEGEGGARARPGPRGGAGGSARRKLGGAELHLFGGPFREQWGLTACLALGPPAP